MGMSMEDPLSSAQEHWAAGFPGVGYTCRVGDDWVCEFVTPQIDWLCGVSASEWLADRHRWLEHVHPEDRERLLLERMHASEADGHPLTTEYRLTTAEGSPGGSATRHRS